MTALRVLAARLGSFLRRGRGEGELDEDIHAHLEMLTQEYLARGMAPTEARAAARRAFGGVDQM